MPLYYLHIRSGPDLLKDEEGFDLVDLAAAHAEAVKGARSLMSADVLDGTLQLDQSIEIHDASGRSLASVQFGDVLNIGLAGNRSTGSSR
jgi:hypothetical protein